MTIGKGSSYSRGFTLIELMIVVTVISILAALALPAYNQYIIRGQRTEGRAALMDAAARQESYYSNNLTYGALLAVGISPTTETGLYTLSIVVGAPAQTYTLTAAPTFTDDTCGSLTITQTGAKGQTTAPVGTISAAEHQRTCWSR